MADTHIAPCPFKAFSHSDAAKRLSDTYRLHRIALGFDANRKWFAVSLADGRGDNVLYDTKLECVTHQHHNESNYAFIRIMAPDMNVCEAEVMLATVRRLTDAGFRMADPDHRSGGMEPIKRLTMEDQIAAMRGRATNLIMPWEA